MEHVSNPSVSTRNFLESCIRIEEICACIYRSFGQLYADNPVMSKLWTETAQEEEEHAEQFRLANRLYGDVLLDQEMQTSTLDAIINKIEALKMNVQKNPPLPADALLTAIILEKSIEKYHTEMSQYFVDKELAEILANMANNGKGHVAMLKMAYEAIK